MLAGNRAVHRDGDLEQVENGGVYTLLDVRRVLGGEEVHVEIAITGVAERIDAQTESLCYFRQRINKCGQL